MTQKLCYTIKTCKTCLEEKPLEDFHVSKSNCKICQRGKKLEYKYGITLQQYNDMLFAQHNGCKICKRSPEVVGTLIVDHNHSCHPGEKACVNCVRGLLCQDCNKGLGYFRDDVNLLEIAINYLR